MVSVFFFNNNNVFTYSILYAFFYMQIIFLLFVFIVLYCNFNSVHAYSLSAVVLFIRNYTPYTNQFFIVFLLLSGLPPVFFFFIKLSFLLKIFSSLSIILIITLFINFLCSMIFYLQVFNVTLKAFYLDKFFKKLKIKDDKTNYFSQVKIQRAAYQF